MRIDITSLCFGFKISKDNDSGTPAWATSIAQAPKGICKIQEEREGLNNILYGMMFKAHSDFDNLKVRNVIGLDSSEEPHGDRERMMFSVFEDVYVNGIKVNGIYTLTYEKEDTPSHKNRKHICYAKYLTYKGHSNKSTLQEMAKALGCSENACWFVYDISIKEQSELHFSAVVVNAEKSMVYESSKVRKQLWDDKLSETIGNEPTTIEIVNKTDYPLQQIYYGAPGTGKSFEIDKITKEYDTSDKHNTIRTTFHPDSDYSTFVGAYKPMMEEVDVQIVPVAVAGGITLDTNKGTYKEKRITYKFVKQAFLKAYLAAWKKYADCKDGEEVQPQFLVIEEINRGNCAQIFGDLFQLLDRQDNGFSSYPIEADADLQREIAEAFAEEGGGYQLPVDGLKLEGVVKNYKGLADKIKNGSILLLPSNLYIWATMNTSDQSLFPIDSAFKRRWDWHYVKIANAGKGYKIKCGDETCDWWTFISAMNEKIAAETSSDDKKLGYFFCKPTKEGEPISVERFVSKVMFYLWNDVFKDGDTKDFNVCDDPNKTATFEAFYNDDNTVNVVNVRKFLVNVVGEKELTKEGDDVPPQEEFDDPVNKIDYTKYSFDGNDRLSKKDLGVKIVQKYISEHADESFESLQKALDFGDKVASKYQYHGVLARTEEIKNSYVNCFVNEEITSSDGVKYKILSWWNKYNINFIIDLAKQQGWVVTESTN